MRRSPWLLRVVTEHRPFLMAVERFHRRVDIKNPGFAQQRPGAIVELFLKPGSPGFLLDLAQCPTHCVPRLRGGRLSLTTLAIPSSGGLTGSQRSVVMWA